jgi:hypothetical protein
MDILGGHLLFDQAARRRRAGPYIEDSFEDDTPDKQPGGQAQPKPMPTKPTPRGIPPRPNVPPLMAPQSLQIRPQPPIPGLEVPGGAVPGENGKPPMPFAPKMPGSKGPPRSLDGVLVSSSWRYGLQIVAASPDREGDVRRECP